MPSPQKLLNAWNLKAWFNMWGAIRHSPHHILMNHYTYKHSNNLHSLVFNLLPLIKFPAITAANRRVTSTTEVIWNLVFHCKNRPFINLCRWNVLTQRRWNNRSTEELFIPDLHNSYSVPSLFTLIKPATITRNRLVTLATRWEIHAECLLAKMRDHWEDGSLRGIKLLKWTTTRIRCSRRLLWELWRILGSWWNMPLLGQQIKFTRNISFRGASLMAVENIWTFSMLLT
jgi:hypothetical protein